MAASALLALPTIASAQGGALNPGCAGGTPRQVAVQDACQKAADIFAYLAPQLGGALAANPVTPIGNFLPLTVSVGAVDGYIPEFSTITTGTRGAQRSNLAVKKTPVPMPSLTGNLTLFKGVETSFGRVGGLSGVITLTLIPDISVGEFSLTKRANAFAFGGGAQVRVFDEGTWRPEVSIAGVQRETPSVLLTAVSAGDTVRADSMQTKTRTFRIEASKHLGWIGFIAGLGQDRYESSAVASGTIQIDPATAALLGTGTSETTAPLALAQTLTRSHRYVGATLGILRATVGEVSGGTLAPTYNSFSEGSTARPLDQKYRYGAVSLTLNF